MDTKALRQKILDLAIRGKLVPQDPNDEPASVLLERIREQKQQMVKEGKLKKKDIKNDSVIFVGEDNLHYEKFADGSVKCIEDEIPFELPEGWAWTRLDSISEIITKGASPKWQGVDYTTSGTLFVTSENVGNETLLMDSPKYLSDRINEIQPRSVLKKHDILTNIVGASIGRTCEYTLDALANTNQAVAIIRLVDLRLVDFIVKCLSSAYSIDLMLKNQVNVARANLSLSSLAKFLIPIPPFIEKERIMKKVSLMFIHIDAISENKTDLETTISMAKSKILDLAIRGQLVPQNLDDEPASVLLERIRAKKEELIKQGKIKRDKKESVIFKGEDNSYYETINGQTECIDDDIPFELPDNWSWARLSHIVQILNGDRGQNYPAKNKLQKNGIPFVSASNIDSGIVSSDDLLCMTDEQYDALGAGKLFSGDIVYCIRGSLGKCGIFTMEKGAIASSLVIVRPIITDSITTQYIFNFLNSNLSKNEITKYDNGSAQPNLAAKDFMRFLVPIPPNNKQREINNLLHKIYSYINYIESALL